MTVNLNEYAVYSALVGLNQRILYADTLQSRAGGGKVRVQTS